MSHVLILSSFTRYEAFDTPKTTLSHFRMIPTTNLCAKPKPETRPRQDLFLDT